MRSPSVVAFLSLIFRNLNNIGFAIDVNSLETLENISAFGAELVTIDFTPMFTLAQLLYGGPWVAERHAAIADFMQDHADDMNEVVRGIVEKAVNFSATDAYRAEYRRADLAREIQTLMSGVDALLVPTSPRHPSIAEVAADPVGVNSQLGTYTNFVNLADCSALALPATMRADGLPFGITLIAPAWREPDLVRWAQQLEAQAGAAVVVNHLHQPAEAAEVVHAIEAAGGRAIAIEADVTDTAQVQQNPAPLVLHGMGKDAKAIKFMVNVEQDLQPQFTETVQQLEALKGPAWLMMDSKDLQSLQGTSLASLQPVLTGRFDKNDYVLLYLKPL